MSVPPREIEQRLLALIPRVRARRVSRGACRLVAAALGAVALILFLDAAFALPAWGRGLFLSVWLTGIGVLAWRWLIVPGRAEISPAEVAAEVEKQLPELGERLRAAVNGRKAEPPDPLRVAIDEDTARRVKTVDLTATLPVKPVVFRVAVAVVPVVAAVVLAVVVPGSGERLRRVALPWSNSNAPPAFDVSVTSGEPVVKRGGPVTLSAFAKRAASTNTDTPPAVLVSRGGPGAPETRRPMTGDGAAYHLTLPSVPSDFEYRVEIGTATSEWFRVTAIDAVELAPGTSIQIIPPAYAKRPKRESSTLSALNALQFSTIDFRLKFTRPAAGVQLEWRPDGSTTSEFVPLTLAADRLGANATFNLRQNGVLKLVLVSEANGKKLRTETPVAVHVEVDSPPVFEQLTGVTIRPRTVRPTATLRIAFAARDDAAVAGAELEYILDSFDSKTVTVPIPLTEQGSPTHATGALDFPLADTAAASQSIRFRVRITDNRWISDPQLGPQTANYPPTGWSELQFSDSAPPLEQQDVICRRDTLRDRLTAASKHVETAAAEVKVLRTETAGGGALAVDHTVRLNNARESLRAATAALHDLARDAALTPELRPLATSIRDVADDPLKRAAELLRTAETHDAPTRANALNNAFTRLTVASGELTLLLAQNALHAQVRLDRMRLTTLAVDQAALADAAKNGDADLFAKQKELLTRLEAIIAESEVLRESVEAAKSGELRRLARTTREIFESLRELDIDARKTATDARAALVTAIAKNQDALTKQTAAIFAKLETPCRLAGVALPRPDDFLRVADLAAAGRTVEALTELEKQVQAIERIAAAFEKWSAERGDPKFAAKQLAMWQDDVLARYSAAAKAGGFAALPAGVKAAFRTEQNALAAAVAVLPIPPDAAVKAARDTALLHANRAHDSLAKGDGVELAMMLAAKSLNLLADRTPTIPARLVISLRAVEAIRQELESIGYEVERVLKSYDRAPDAAAMAALAKKLAPQAERQKKLIPLITALDLPGLEERQARGATALAAAASDLLDGSPFDIPASQAWARRELERLKLVLEGHASPDAVAAELHRKFIALADSLDTHGAKLTMKHLELAKPLLQDAGRQLAVMVAPEAPALLNDARGAVQGAELLLRDADPTPARRRIRAAAEALGKLSDRLHGSETNLERVQRLTSLRRQAAEKPKEILFSDEAVRQLGRESDELTFTRVGVAGQALKKRALDLYAKLRAKSDPDRIGTDLKALANTLDELAAKMADVADLATSAPRGSALTATPDAENYLPSKPLADALRELAKRQRTLHAQVTNLAVELSSRLRPSVLTSARRTVLLQVRRAYDLAHEVSEFAGLLEVVAKSLAVTDAASPVLREAAKLAKDVGRHLADAAKNAAEGNTADAERHRALAGTLLLSIHGKLDAVAPDVPSAPGGDALRAAERAMRRALEQLNSGMPSEQAMRDAAKWLGDAANRVGK